MQLKLSLVLLFAIVCTVYAIVCPEDYCTKHNKDCNNGVEKNDCETNKNGIFEQHGTLCGCCPACLTKLEKGQGCALTVIQGMPPQARCASGLTCDLKTKTCVEKQ